ncbi:hypothetical protein AAA434_12195 [Lactobacillus crispatus]|uniref:hypothetical protein n=1 Tax=Lactobacillus crispatus TaxID=47770 RepID=UPI0030F67386
MQKLVNTVSKEDLLKIPFPKTDDIGLIIVDVETFIKDLKRDIALGESGEDDWHKYRITSVWDSTDPETVLDQLKDFNSQYGLIIMEDGMDPEVDIHTLTKTEMKALAELQPYELNEKVVEYCGKLAKICNDNAESECVECRAGMPSKYSKSVLKTDLDLDLC